MGIKVDLDEDLEKEFRELAMKRFGYSKGSIKKATESAIRQWTSSESHPRPSPKESKKQKKSGVVSSDRHVERCRAQGLGRRTA